MTFESQKLKRENERLRLYALGALGVLAKTARYVEKGSDHWHLIERCILDGSVLFNLKTSVLSDGSFDIEVRP